MEADTSRKFSPSKLGTYQDCPRRYQYRYVDKIKRETTSVEAFLGTCVHSALEELYDGIAHGKTLSLEAVLGVYERAWEAGWSDHVKIRDARYSREEWRGVGRDCLRGYYLAHQPFDEDKTVEVEKRIGFPLAAAGEEVRIEGFIDRLALAPDGAFEIHDYKTGRSLPAQADLDADWQLAIYDAAVRHAWPDTRKVRLVWHYLRHGKTLVSTRTEAQLAALKDEVARLIEAIRRDHEFSPRKSALCDWCEYRDLCPLWSHSEKLASLPAQERKSDAGLALADQFGELDARRKALKDSLKALEREQKEVEAALLRYARQRGLLAVAGSEGEAAITEREDYKFPTKTHSPEALEGLERELRASPIWSEVSHLDSHRLMEAYKRKEWPRGVLQLVEGLLERYVKKTTEWSVRFRRKREIQEE